MASPSRALDRKDVQSVLRHFVIPAISGGIDAAVQLVSPILLAWKEMQPVPPFSAKQAVGVIGHAMVVAGGAAVVRLGHRWWIDLKAKVGAGADPKAEN